MLRGLYISISVYSLSVVAQYVCKVEDFRRISKEKSAIEKIYQDVVTSCAQISSSLFYASQHAEIFPGYLSRATQLVPCRANPQQLWLPSPANALLGVHVLNKTRAGIRFNATAIDEEIQFLRPIVHVLPTFLANSNRTIYFIGLAMNCAAIYSFPPRSLCGSLPDNIDLCAFYNNRYNLYAKLPDVRADAERGGHWSEPLQSAGQPMNAYTIGIADSAGKFRVQVQLGVAASRVMDEVIAKQPSANGYTFILSQDGNVVYAQQGAIDVLFGPQANLTLETVTASYIGNQQRVVGTSLQESKTNFSELPRRLNSTETIANVTVTNGSNTTTYYVAWERFRENTLRTWFMVSMIPQIELNEAAVWSVTPPFGNVTLTDERTSVNMTFVVKNDGFLPVSFYAGPIPFSRGLLINTSAEWYTLGPGSRQAVQFVVQLTGSNPPPTSRFLTPFYANPIGTYAACFAPQFVDLTVNYVRKRPPEPRLYALITVSVLCCFTALLVLVALTMLYRYRHSPPVLAISPRICVFKLMGLLCLLGGSTANIIYPTVVSCEIARWLFNVGFCLTGAATVAKNYRLRRIFYSKKLHIVPLTNFQLMGFIFAVVFVDIVLLSVGSAIESYTIQPNRCVPQGWVIFILLILTKIFVWTAAFLNTISLARIPMAFADSRLNGVLVIVSILASIYIGLQFSGVLDNNPLQLLFIGSMFIWLGAFITCCHMLLKLRSGYVVVVRPRARTNSISLTPPSTQNRLRSRLGALLEEMEFKQVRLTTDKINSIENLEANQRLLFELRAMLLTFEAHDGEVSYDEEVLERHLPESIKAAFDKNERAVIRRMEGDRPTPKRNTPTAADNLYERKFSPTNVETPHQPFVQTKQETPVSKTRRIVIEPDTEAAASDSISPARTADEAQSLLQNQIRDQSIVRLHQLNPHHID